MQKIGLLVAAGLFVSSAVQAEPGFARLYKHQFAYNPSCNACHKDGGGSDLNAYGEAFKQAGLNAAAFAAIAAADADGDGHSNQTEAQAKANPGDGRSTPDAPGNWLDTAQLIPKDVQKLFPEVRAYKPLDTLLTEKEISRAQALGVTLDSEDETTIYIPVQSGKAIGTAIIVPGELAQERFYVLLATDRQLTVTHASLLHAGETEGLDEAALYEAVIGHSVDKLPAAPESGSAAARAVNDALRKAGVLLHVRLKSQ